MRTSSGDIFFSDSKFLASKFASLVCCDLNLVSSFEAVAMLVFSDASVKLNGIVCFLSVADILPFVIRGGYQ
jgi:hypothetical protein